MVLDPPSAAAQKLRREAEQGRSRAFDSLTVAPLAIATGLLLHLAVGYRPFPSIDDFAYLPVFRHAADPTLYASDVFLRSMTPHSLGWSWFFRLCEASIGCARGMWLAVLCLAGTSVLAVFRIAQTLGARVALLPLMAVLAFASSLHGIGRGVYDGAFGAAFHGQWLALVISLFAYDAFIRQRALRCGVLLGAVFLAHFSVGMHAAFVLGLAAFSTTRPIRTLTTLVGASAVVALPALVAVLPHLAGSTASSWTTARVITDGYVFRLTHEYDIGLGRAGNLAALLLCLAGAGGALLLRQSRTDAALRRIMAITAGQAILVGLALVFYGPLGQVGLLPYVLSLTRTSPLLVVLLCVLAFSGLEAFARNRDNERPFELVAAAAVTLALFLEMRMLVAWNGFLLILAGLTVWLLAAQQLQWRPRATRLLLILVATAAFAEAGRRDVLLHVPEPAAVELFDWARDQTARDAVFIVPPGFEEFRWYAKRSAYVDFKLFPPASIDSVAEWRERLDQVSAPDRMARAENGWRAARQYDRCYANRNTPERVAELLSSTGADYLIWDAKALRIPPFSDTPRPMVESLIEDFHNHRFRVYSLRGNGVGL